MTRVVVVAEDDSELRGMIARALARDGFEVTEVENGEELLRLIELITAGATARPRVIVADVRMPGATGLQALGLMRRLKLDVPVVLVTAFGDAQTHALARRLGAAALLDKPFDMRDLSSFVVDLVGRPAQD